MAALQPAKRKARTVHVPEDESSRDRFERIGKRRVLQVMNTIRLLGNLSSSRYRWTPNDVEVIRMAIVDQLDKAVAKFSRMRMERVMDFQFGPVVDPPPVASMVQEPPKRRGRPPKEMRH